MTLFEARQVEIATLEVDAIVTAPLDGSAGASGVNAAIHRGAGPELEAAHAGLGPVAAGDVGCTPGFLLPARHVIHTAPLPLGSGAAAGPLIAASYEQAVAAAAALGCRSLAFPAIQAGPDALAPEQAASIAVAAARKAAHLQPVIERIVFACPDEASVRLHRQALEMPY